MRGAVERVLVPLGVRVGFGDGKGRGTVGGFFIWLEMPGGVSAKEVVRVAGEREKLVLSGGELFGVLGDEATVDLSRCVRICFAWEEEGRLVEGVERLGRVVRGLLNRVDDLR